MKQQIAVLSPHQNGKVVGALMAVTALVLAIPFVLFALLLSPQSSAPSALYVILFPVVYLVMGYFIVSLVCCVYNYLYRFIGGVEFESKSADA
jgi:hypothetical protein